jgi:hypothetical protein
MTSHRAYPQNDPGVARNLQAKFGADRTVPEFPAIFFLKGNPRFYQVAVTSSRPGVIIDDVTSRLPAERFWGGEEPPGQVWRGSQVWRSGWRAYPEHTDKPTDRPTNIRLYR